METGERKPQEESRHMEYMFSPLNWLQTDIVSLRQELGSLRQETKAEFSTLRQEMGSLRQETEQKMNKLETGLRQEIKKFTSIKHSHLVCDYYRCGWLGDSSVYLIHSGMLSGRAGSKSPRRSESMVVKVEMRWCK